MIISQWRKAEIDPYWFGVDSGSILCAKCAHEDGIERRDFDPVDSGCELVCCRCGETRSAIIVEGFVDVEYVPCKIF